MLRQFGRIAALVLVLLCWIAQPPAAEDAPLTRAELDELVTALEATMAADADFARAEENARQLYGLVQKDFGEETREAIEVERLIVLAVTAQSRQDEAAELGRQMMEKAIRLLPNDDPLAYRVAAVYVGALKTTGKFDEALNFAYQAVDEAEKHLPPGSIALQELRIVMAGVAQVAGQPDIAQSAYAAIDAGVKGRDDPESLAFHALALQGWARLIAEYGDPAEAVPLFREAIAALERQFAGIPRPRMVPLRLATVVALSEAMIRTGQLAQVVDLLRPEIAGVADHYGDDSTIWADMAFPLAVALAEKRPDSPGAPEALDLLRRIVAIYAEAFGPRTKDLLRARLNLAVLLAGRGLGREALEQIAAMDGAAQPGDRAQIVYVLRMAEEQGSITRDEAVGEILRWLQDSQSRGAAAAQGLLAERLAAGSDAGAALLRQRTDITAQIDGARAQLAAQMVLPKDQRDATAVSALRAEITRQDAALSDVRASLARGFPDLAQATGSVTLSLAEVRARLGRDSALVVVDTPQGDDDYGLVVAVSDTDVDWHTFQVAGSEVDGAVAALRDSIDLRLGVRSAVALSAPAPEAPAAFVLDRAHWLYRQTLGQVAGVIDGRHHLFLDLRGAVAALPPQLLVMTPPAGDDPRKADWLIRHHAVTILPAISALPRGTVARAPGTGFMAFADARFDGIAPAAPVALRGALGPLPETAGEVRAVAGAMGQGEGTLHLGAQASEAAVKAAALGDIGTLYFATHGLVGGDVVGGDALPEAALALTPGGGEDGFLGASEIIGLHLNARIVVLSACNTATGGVPGAEALSGLTQAFLYAGARGLIVSHWPVESRSAAALMADTFQRRAADPGAGTAEALRQAMLGMIDGDPKWSHPAYWAPFVVVGNPD